LNRVRVGVAKAPLE